MAQTYGPFGQPPSCFQRSSNNVQRVMPSDQSKPPLQSCGSVGANSSCHGTLAASALVYWRHVVGGEG